MRKMFDKLFGNKEMRVCDVARGLQKRWSWVH